MRRLAAILIRSFLQGLLILCPIAITAYIIYLVFDRVDSIIPSVPRGLGFVIVVFCVTMIGWLGTRFFLGRMMIEAFDHLLEHTPGIKYLYTSVKDVMDSFVGDKKRFNKPVWVCINHNPETWRIGFLTQTDMAHLGLQGRVAVYLPHAYAISGYVIIADAKSIKPITKMNAAEAMKFAVSGGIANLDELHKTHKG
ncbi:DUF502 domain-containing protein [Taibaiella soli]|uniref:DUF502 domain-containing protein n=1 Tax=Taibaiella soli TaxID=1649169 RepID=A0A2W2ACC3_9BACT|nr:DUF502 domain-containing protein [Taibaiella soli]PZF72941.1 hypothetical protein DN068_11050 [Taibaiella soli]